MANWSLRATWLAVGCALGLVAGTVFRSDPVHAPMARWQPDGRDTLAVLFVSSTCPACNQADFMSAVSAATTDAASDSTSSVRFAAVAVDWDSFAAIRYLDQLGLFSEIAVGNGWANSSVLRWVWSDSLSVPAVPQLALIERRFGTDSVSSRIQVLGDTIVGRILGAGAIQSWMVQFGTSARE